jgi:hypothetical protein
MLDENGKPITEQVKDGTITYYDLWPEKPVGQTKLQDNVKEDYNACSNNCSTFVQNGIKTVFPSFDSSQLVKPSFPLNQMYNDARVVAPNNLYNGALKIKGASSIKGPKQVQAKPYLEYFGKSNRP